MEWSNTPQLAVGYFNVCVYKKASLQLICAPKGGEQ